MNIITSCSNSVVVLPFILLLKFNFITFNEFCNVRSFTVIDVTWMVKENVLRLGWRFLETGFDTFLKCELYHFLCYVTEMRHFWRSSTSTCFKIIMPCVHILLYFKFITFYYVIMCILLGDINSSGLLLILLLVSFNLDDDFLVIGF
jgi:general stress protein CsbA